MPLQSIAQLLQARMGLHSSTVGSSTIAKAVEQRMRLCGIEAVEDYRSVIHHSDTELNALIDTVVIPETWFFRDPNAFSALRHWISTQWMPSRGAGALRVLSIPCSSGEEPYTLAMCLSDCGLGPTEAHIDAIDISSINLEKARRAEYSDNSFRGHDLTFRDRYFHRQGLHYVLTDAIRQWVSFERGNLLDASFAAARAPYHVIFCRNLLIYFNRATQHAAIDRLEQLLTERGLLFLGHSETSLLQKRGFAPLGYERCFGFRREGAFEPDAPLDAPRSRRARTRRPPSVVAAPKPPRPLFQTALPSVKAPDQTAPPDKRHVLQRAFELADQGHMDEAAECCESLLTAKAYQADAHYLLGLIREAAGNTQEAEEMFRKAVYLQPDHYEALVHLSVICEKAGDRPAARRLRERAARAEGRCRSREATT
jgi:chemotaxis protein methyltransferase WspC